MQVITFVAIIPDKNYLPFYSTEMFTVAGK